MRKRSKGALLTLLALVVAALALAALFTLPAPKDPDRPGRLDGLRSAAAHLQRKGIRADFAQDYVGARALLHHRDPYPVAGVAFDEIGLDWPLRNRSTHPPTAFLFALPLASLTWPHAAAVWAAAMLAAFALVALAFGAPMGAAIAIAPLALLWPPAAWSLGQLTPIWLLGAALAWRWRDRPFLAGLAVGAASLTKLLPILMLVAFLLRRRWAALAGCAVVWGSAVLLLLVLNPSSITRFVEVERTEGREQAARADNAGLLELAWHRLGTAGLVGALALVVAVGAQAWRRTTSEGSLRFEAFSAWVWLSVALLPIVWLYSLLPLAPTLLGALRTRLLLPGLAAGAALLIPVAIQPFGTDSATLLAVSIALTGVATLFGANNRSLGTRVRRWSLRSPPPDHSDGRSPTR